MPSFDNNENRTLSGYERFEQLCQEKQRKANGNEPIIVPAAIKMFAWVTLIAGVLCTIFGLKDGTWIYGISAIAVSAFFFGFSAIVKAAYKYLGK